MQIVPKDAAKNATSRQSCVVTALVTARNPTGNPYLDKLEEIQESIDPHWCRGIQPLTEGRFTCLGIVAPEGPFAFDWHITEVRGYQKPK
jgi:hypothetical protein